MGIKSHIQHNTIQARNPMAHTHCNTPHNSGRFLEGKAQDRTLQNTTFHDRHTRTHARVCVHGPWVPHILFSSESAASRSCSSSSDVFSIMLRENSSILRPCTMEILLSLMVTGNE